MEETRKRMAIGKITGMIEINRIGKVSKEDDEVNKRKKIDFFFFNYWFLIME